MVRSTLDGRKGCGDVFEALLLGVDAEEHFDEAGRHHEAAADQVADRRVPGRLVAIRFPNRTGPMMPPRPVPTA